MNNKLSRLIEFAYGESYSMDTSDNVNNLNLKANELEDILNDFDNHMKQVENSFSLIINDYICELCNGEKVYYNSMSQKDVPDFILLCADCKSFSFIKSEGWSWEYKEDRSRLLDSLIYAVENSKLFGSFYESYKMSISVKEILDHIEEEKQNLSNKIKEMVLKLRDEAKQI